MNKTDNIVNDIVSNIIADLTSRGGLDDMWSGIDEEIQEEIINEWKKIVKREINKL